MNIKIEITIDGEKVSVNAPVVEQARIENPEKPAGVLPPSFEDAVQQMMVGAIPKKTEPQA